MWDVGFLDSKNVLFYELGQITNNSLERTLFFKEWISVLEVITNEKLYNDLFKNFGFIKSKLTSNDRKLHEPQFFPYIKMISNKIKEINFEKILLSHDFMIYWCNLFKSFDNLISYAIFKSKIYSNLQNFKDLSFTSTVKKINK